MLEAHNKGVRIEAELLGEIPDRTALLSTPQLLYRQLATDGYALLRNVLPVDDVLAARQEVLGRLANVGEIAEPSIDGIITGRSERIQKVGDLTEFWRSVSCGKKLRAVTHGNALKGILANLLDGEVVGHDLVYLRVAAPGRSVDLHYDYPFFTRGTKDVFTTWIPLGDVPVTDGPLYVVEGSNQFEDLIQEIKSVDQSGPPTRKLSYEISVSQFAADRRARILTANFRAGDVAIFGLLTAHGSLDNCSDVGRARVSCDLRYQRADAPRDDRFFGEDPGGVTGNGYADINGAKPLTASWQTR